MKLSREDRQFTLLMLLLIALLSAGLYYSYKYRIGSSGYESVGIVRYKYHVVMRKYSDRMIWEDVDPDTPVYLFDAVLTKEKSDAEIVLNNGMKLDMDPNSMVIIDMIDDQIGIAMQSGSVRAETNNSNSFIVTEDGTMIQLKSASARITNNQDGLQLDVKSGKTHVTAQGKQAEVRQGETLLLDKKTGTRSIVKSQIQAGTPDDGSLFATDQSDATVTFKWQAKDASEQNLLIADNPTLDNSRKINVTGKSSHSEKLPPGNYYWQVQAKDKNKIPITSQTANFKIKREATAIALLPKSGAIFSEDEAILFRWQSSDEKAPMVFRLAKDRNFTQPVMERKIGKDRLLLDNLKPGEYWWRVDSYSGKPGSVQSFKVAQANTVNAAAEDIHPANNHQENTGNKTTTSTARTQTDSDEKLKIKKAEEQRQQLALAEPRKVELQAQQQEIARFRMLSPQEGSDLKPGSTMTFTWEKVNLPVKYHFQLSKQADMQQPIVSRTTDSDSLTIDRPASGVWYWQVSLLDAKTGKVLKEGEVHFFKIRGPIVRPEPPKVTNVTVE